MAKVSVLSYLCKWLLPECVPVTGTYLLDYIELLLTARGLVKMSEATVPQVKWGSGLAAFRVLLGYSAGSIVRISRWPASRLRTKLLTS